MKQASKYIAINRELWNKKTDFHIASTLYDNENFIKGNSSLNEIEFGLIGDIKGKKVLHLQCHFGQDTISLERLGAEVTGIDFSEKAIARAKELAEKTNSKATFICSDVYALPKVCDQKFDMVFTSYGTIGWLPDMEKWAKVVSHFLKPNGKFVFVEFHPVVWMFNDDFSKIKYNYFKTQPIEESEIGTYADKHAPINLKSVTWNHSMSEVVNSLLTNGLSIELLNEYDYSPYNCFNKTQKIAEKKYRIEHLANTIPMVYAIVATKTKKN